MIPQDAIRAFRAVVGERNCITAPEELRTYECDGLTSFRATPGVVVLPGSGAEVVEVVKIAHAHRLPVVPRGSGTGLSGGALPVKHGVLVGLQFGAELADAIGDTLFHGRPPFIGRDGDPLDEIRHPYMPLSSDEVDYPLLRELHAASSLETPLAVTAWRRGGAMGPRAAEVTSGVLVPLPAPRAAAGRGLGETIQRRGSTRQFGHEALTAVELSTALGWATRPVAADVPQGLVDLYLIVNAVEGVAPGAYVYRRDAHALELVKAGELRRESAYLCLEQPLGGDAAAVIYFLAPLDDVLGAFGDRGYRLVNLEAGIAGGRAYLAAYAQGFGASGLTFYDRLVVEFFAPHAAGRDAIFVTALGRSAAGGRVTIGTTLGRPRRPPA